MRLEQRIIAIARGSVCWHRQADLGRQGDEFVLTFTEDDYEAE